MRIVLGPFHPNLEDTLVEEIAARKNADLLDCLLVVVPSDSLRRRVNVLLARERKLCLLNVHVLTFHQLSLSLFEEARGLGRPRLHNNGFLEEALGLVIQSGACDASFLGEIGGKAGGCSALWQSLRDLKDAMVEPARILEAVDEGHFDAATAERVSSLVRMLECFLSRCEGQKILDYADLDKLVMGQVPGSEFLHQFGRIFYYGFYDLTQVQIDLFHSVAGHFPTTLLFPLIPGHPAWRFAERFYERHVLGKGEVVTRADDLMATTARPPRASLPLFADSREESHDPRMKNLSDAVIRCTTISCSARSDEVVTAAKEILRLVSHDGIAFRNVGVVARSLEPYLARVKSVFAEHLIPITTRGEEPLVRFPLAKALLLLTEMVSSDYRRSRFLDLVSSPFFRLRSFCADDLTPRPDLWDILTRKLGITKGLEEWSRLERYTNRSVALWRGEDEAENSGTVSVPPRQIQLLWSIFTQIRNDLMALPSEDSWSGHAESWKALFEKYLGTGEGESAEARETAAREEILCTIDELAGLDALCPTVSLAAFLQALRRLLDRASIPATDPNQDGVAVLDAMSARGIPFRVLFILGLNEGMFPRTIHEEPFLKDNARRVLETTLGYKISEKLAGFDEEKLLFALLIGSVRERLYCLHSRCDEKGRPLAPSWYLSELSRALGGSVPFVERIVPRSGVEKQGVPPYNEADLLPPEDLAVRLSLASQDPGPAIELLPTPVCFYQRGRRMVDRLQAPSRGASGFCGFTGPLPEQWNRLREQGVSPTTLERYAFCPFQFFAREILGLERVERPEEIAGLGPADKGKIGHTLLRSFYEELLHRGRFATRGATLELRPLLQEVARKVFSDYEAENPVGYRVEWEVFQEELVELIDLVVAKDVKELSESGYIPVAFEADAAERLVQDWPQPLAGMGLRGRMDRVDRCPEENRYRVIDYKFKWGRNRTADSKDLVDAALQGRKLQPPFYLLLGKRFAADHGAKSPEAKIETSFYFLAPEWKEGPLFAQSFPSDAWEGKLGAGLTETLAHILEGIHRGQFFVHPGEYCQYCEVSEACRKNHLPTRWYTEATAGFEQHQRLQKKKRDT